MNAPSVTTGVHDSLARLDRRVRWKNWLNKLHRFAWLFAAVFVALFVADWLIGLNTLSLRIAAASLTAGALALFVADWGMAWLVRFDRVGLAQLLEKRYPELAERLVTLVQLETEPTESGFAPLLRDETAHLLVDLDPDEACPLHAERKRWLIALAVLTAIFGGLCFIPGFAAFTERFAGAWTMPLAPYTIEFRRSDIHVLSGGSCAVEVRYRMLDPRAAAPTECELIITDASGETKTVAMQSASPNRFVAELPNLRESLHGQARSGKAWSETLSVSVVEPPVFAHKPTLLVSSPKYVSSDANPMTFDKHIKVLRYSKLTFQGSLSSRPVRATLNIHVLDVGGVRKLHAQSDARLTQTAALENVAAIADRAGDYFAELALELEHGLTTTLPIGKWTVHDDRPPRFTQTLRLHGGGAAFSAATTYRIAADDSLKLQTAVEDDEGLEWVSLEYRINEGPPKLQKWLNATGKKQLVINDWLPLPSGLQADDRVQFRIHVSDNRRMKKGELATDVPGEDLLPQMTIAPSDVGDASAWVTLKVDRAVKDFFKEQVEAQADEIRDVILKIRAKVQDEAEQVETLKKKLHQQTALTLGQMEQADKLRELNREIALDLLAAGRRFLRDPELAKLAEHFLEIAEVDITKSAEALNRFSEKDRPLPEAEKELGASLESLTQARIKLDRMLGWNKLLAQDRLDQFQIEKLAKRQDELAERLQKLLPEQPKNDPETAKEIEAIRQEQAKIEKETEQLRQQSRLAQEGMAAEQEMHAQKLAKEAEELAAQQRAMREAGPEKMSPEMQARLDKLAERQADLAKRVQPFAAKNQGPDVKPAEAAADSLKKPKLDDAIGQQKEHEKRLQEWLGKVAPGTSANSLREQVLQLLKKQQAITADLEKLGKDAESLDLPMQKQRVSQITARQEELAAAIAKLAIDAKDEPLRAAQKNVQGTAQQAVEQMKLENFAGTPAAYKLMKKAEKELAALAEMMPRSLPSDPKNIKDPAVRAQAEAVDAFAREQAKLREETEKLKNEVAKGSGGTGKGPPSEKLEKLVSELMELSQKASSPEAKAMAKESAQAIESAKKSMEASQAMKAKGDADGAKKMDANAEKQLDIAAKQLKQLAQDAAMKNMPKDPDAKTAEALKESTQQMREAQKNLPGQPKDAQSAMKAAAKSLEKAGQQAGKQASKMLPNAARNPAAKDATPITGFFPGSNPKNLKLEAFQGKAWGELPGELRTQMLQDVRVRFGEEYAEMIRDYFESLARSPRK